MPKMIDELENSKNNKDKKSQVFELLRSQESLSIMEIANKLNISTKNVWKLINE